MKPTYYAGVLSWNKLTALGMFALHVGSCEPEFHIQGPTLILDEICELLKAIQSKGPGTSSGKVKVALLSSKGPSPTDVKLIQPQRY